ncbi:MAG TPA: transposase [Planctomycetaceae bacterium]
MEVAVAEPQQQTEPRAGLECPNCGCRHFYTIRTVPKNRYVYRRRECRHCGKVVTTTERIIGGE